MSAEPSNSLSRLQRAALALAVLMLGVRCSGDPADGDSELGNEDPPNVVLVLVDTLRADHTSVYGYERRTTPHLERIAAEGLVMRNHFASAPWTKPSVASIITGLHPSAHGSRVGLFKTMEKLAEMKAKGRNATVEVLVESHECLAESLSSAGLHTAAYINNYHLTDKFGYQQGYDEYHFKPGGPFDDAAHFEGVKATLSTQEGPAFVWCHTMSVHQYISPDEFKVFSPEGSTPIPPDTPHARRVRKYADVETPVADYDNAILYTDSLLGDLFDWIKAEEPNTILIVTADHGEEFYEHGSFEHGHTLYNELLRVPLVIWGPGVPVGEVTGITDSIDIYPTLLNAVGYTPSEDLTGEVLFDAGQPTEGKLETFAEKHFDNGPKLFSLVRNGSKLILSRDQKTGDEAFEFFVDGFSGDVPDASDSTDPANLKRYRKRLQALLARAKASFKNGVGATEVTNLNDYDIQKLHELGYIGN